MTSGTKVRSLLLAVCVLLVTAYGGGCTAPTSNPSMPSQPSPTLDKTGTYNSSISTKNPTPTPSPPLAVSQTEERQTLKHNVETALREVKDSSASSEGNRARIAQLESRVDQFNKNVEVPGSNIDELKTEANEIIAEANRIADQRTPSFWTVAFGWSLTDYLARFAALGLLLMSASMLVLLVRLQSKIKETSSSLNQLSQLLEPLKDAARRLETTPSFGSSERSPTTNDQGLDNLSKDLHSVRDQIISSLEEFRTLLPGSAQHEKETESEISQDENVRTDGSILCKEVYVGDFLQNVAKDRQIPVRYEIANQNFVADPSGKLVVVTDDSKINEAILLPKASRLSSPDQFDTYYTQAYDCDRLSLGTLFILTPAVVEKENDGWKLATRGTLELRN